MRRANEIDFWRGLALVSIFLNHIPGFAFERLTHRNYGLSDSAELFVFLAGWSLRLIAGDPHGRSGLLRLVLWLGSRGVTLYVAQIVVTILAIGLIAAASLLLDNPLLLEWNNADAVFQDPVPTHLGIVLLTHQLGFFDILPLYVVLMFAAPGMALIHAFAPRLLLPISVGIYAVALSFNLNLPTWPVEGVWYFDPFAWQLVFTLGFAFAGPDGPGRFARRHLRILRPVGLAIVALGAWLALSDYAPGPLRVPIPPLFLVFDKTYLSPARLVHFLGLAALFAGSFPSIARAVPPLARFLSMLGRHSLYVFCVGSLLSLAGQLVRVALGGGVAVDSAVLVVGIAALGSTAWLSELRERLRRSSPPVAPASS